MVREPKNLLDLEEKAITAPLDELQSQIQAFNEELAHILRGKDDALFIIRGELDRLLNVVEEDLEAFKRSEIPVLREKITLAAGEREHLPLRRFAKELEEFLPLNPEVLLNLLPRRVAQRHITRKIQQQKGMSQVEQPPAEPGTGGDSEGFHKPLKTIAFDPGGKTFLTRGGGGRVQSIKYFDQ